MNYAGRIARLREAAGVSDGTVFVVTRPDSIAYFCGFTGSFGDLVVTPDRAVLATDGRYALRARTEAVGVETHIGWQARELLPEVLSSLDTPSPAAALMEAEGLSLPRWERLLVVCPHGWSLQARCGVVDPLRAVKDADEIALLRKACAITDAAWADVQPELRPGCTERWIARRIAELQLDHGADEWAHLIVASGPNSAMPHHTPTDRVVKGGDLLKVDVGAKYGGYCSDLTRTVIIGEPTDLQCGMYDAVYRAQIAACAAMRAGATGEDVDRAARCVIRKAGFGDYYTHNLGHGLGRAKEPPHIVAGSVFEPGNVLTIEPGVYIEGVGGVRIEDLGLVTDDGFEPMSLAPKPPTLQGPGGA